MHTLLYLHNPNDIAGVDPSILDSNKVYIAKWWSRGFYTLHCATILQHHPPGMCVCYLASNFGILLLRASFEPNFHENWFIPPQQHVQRRLVPKSAADISAVLASYWLIRGAIAARHSLYVVPPAADSQTHLPTDECATKLNDTWPTSDNVQQLTNSFVAISWILRSSHGWFPFIHKYVFLMVKSDLDYLPGLNVNRCSMALKFALWP